MSKTDEKEVVDWGEILHGEPTKVEVTKEELIEKLQKVTRARNNLPTAAAVRLFFVSLNILAWLGIVYYVETNYFPFKWGIYAFLCFQIYFLCSYFVMVYRLNRGAKGK